MSAHHDPAHVARLEGLLAEANDPRAAFAHSELAACATCSEELDALLDAAQRLDALGDDTREAVADGRAEGLAPGEARVERYVRAQLGLDAPTRRPNARWWSLAIAAAAALAVYVVWPRDDSTRPEPGPPLNAGAIELVHPTASVDEWSDFRWRAALPDGGWFRVRVRATPDSPVLIESLELREQQWHPAPEELSRLPRAIHWEVVLFDDAAQPSDSASTSASLR